MKSGGHSNGKDNDEVLEGIIEASGAHDQGTNGNSDQRSERHIDTCQRHVVKGF